MRIDIKLSFVISVLLHFLFFFTIGLFAKKSSSKIYYIPIQVIGYGSGGGGGYEGSGDVGGAGGGESGEGVSTTKTIETQPAQKAVDSIKSGDIVASKVVSKTTKLAKKDILKWEKVTGKGTGTGSGSSSGGGSGGGFGSGLGGGIGVDVGNFPYIGYVNILRNKVAQNWNPSPYTSAGVKKVLVYFKILKDGKIENLTIKEPSGVSYIDRSAIRAITNSAPFPPLPVGFPDSSLGVYFKFELSGS